MSKLLILLALVIPASYAQDKAKVEECLIDRSGLCRFETQDLKKELVKEKTPKQFKSSNIKRKLKDGSYQEFNGDKFKIVPRTQKKFTKKKTKKAIRPVLVREKIVKKNITHKNRVSLLVGLGPSGDLNCQNNANSSNFRSFCETERKVNFGIQGLRDFYTNDSYSVHGLVQVKTNREVSVGLGLGF